MPKEVSNELKFLPDESVVKRAEKVGHGSNPLTSGNNELILTNMALILVKKSLFGKIKEVVRYPLSDIRRSGNSVEVKLSKPDRVNPMLDIYFNDGIESLKFTFDSEVEDWIADITETITGVKVQRKSELEGFEDLLHFADSAAGTIKHIKSAFGIKSTEQAACACPGCGASLHGTDGDTIQCPYCGTYVKIEI